MKKVFVFGIDGAMPEKIFEEWLEELPNIKKLMKQGCYAKLNSTIPPLSVTAWTSMTTGKRPAEHGIFEYLYRDNNLPGKMNLTSSFNVKEKRIWEILSEKNKKAITCFVPLTWPVKPFEGIIISGPPALVEKGKFAYPQEIENEVENISDNNFQMDIRFFRDLTKKDISENIKKVTKNHLEIMKYLIKNKDWDFFFGVITGSDRMNHSFWRYSDPEHRKYDPNSEFKDTLKNFYKFLDKELGEIMNLLDEDTTIIVLSDHGFTRMHTRVNLSDWLIKEGYLVLKQEIKISSPTKLEHDMIDWEKTKAFAIGAYDGQIYLNLKGRDASGVVEQKEYDKLINEIGEKIKKITGDDGIVLDTKIFKKKDYFRGKCETTAPDIVIYFDNLHYGCNPSLIGNNTLWSPSTAIGSDDATHAEQGIFIINTPFKKKGYVGEIDILDVAPIILNLLNVNVPKDFEGKIIR